MTTYLIKTEPSEYSYDDLVREKRTVWDGVTNPAARMHMRAIKKGDEVFVYHTGNEKAIVGVATVVKGAYPDPDEPGVTAKGEMKSPLIEIAPKKRAKTPVTLEMMKADERFSHEESGFALVREPRLSVMPVPAGVAELIRKMAGI
ncbi:MAG: EVE domain-containing protein [Phycisphaerales bacterium]